MPSRDLASGGLRHMIEVTVLSHHGSPFFVKVIIFGAKRWQYFTEYVSASVVEVVGGLSEASAALVYSFFCLNFFFKKRERKERKKKVLWELVKEYLRSVLSFLFTSLYCMSLNIYISLLDLIPLLPLGSSVYLKDERVSCKCWWSNILHPSECIWLEQMEPLFSACWFYSQWLLQRYLSVFQTMLGSSSKKYRGGISVFILYHEHVMSRYNII